jgi:hypothetical protein
MSTIKCRIVLKLNWVEIFRSTEKMKQTKNLFCQFAIFTKLTSLTKFSETYFLLSLVQTSKHAAIQNKHQKLLEIFLILVYIEVYNFWSNPTFYRCNRMLFIIPKIFNHVLYGIRSPKGAPGIFHKKRNTTKYRDSNDFEYKTCWLAYSRCFLSSFIVRL